MWVSYGTYVYAGFSLYVFFSWCVFFVGVCFVRVTIVRRCMAYCSLCGSSSLPVFSCEPSNFPLYVSLLCVSSVHLLL